MIRTYTELLQLNTFEDRFNYLNLNGVVGEETFGYERRLNQMFYKSNEWKDIRRDVIIRDMSCDLGIAGHYINNHVIIHHINPITIQDILERSVFAIDPEYLICTTHRTHNALHYGNLRDLYLKPITRTLNDTCPWRH